MSSLSKAGGIEKKKLRGIIEGLGEGVADKYFVFEEGEIRYREEQKGALKEFLQEEFSKWSKTSTIHSLASFKSTISGKFEWDRRSPLPAGREFFCSPFELTFEVSEFAPKGLIKTLKREKFTDDRDTLGFRNFHKHARSTGEIFELLQSFMTKFLKDNALNMQSPTPHNHDLTISPYFIERAMYYQQSLKRYGLRPSKKSK